MLVCLLRGHAMETELCEPLHPSRVWHRRSSCRRCGLVTVAVVPDDCGPLDGPASGARRALPWSRRIVGCAAAVALLAPPADAAAGGYATILFGRGQMVQGDGACRALPNTVTLFTAAAALRERGLPATAAVTVSDTLESARRCGGGISYASWQDLATLRDSYRFSAVSRGQRGLDARTLTASQMREESCGSLAAFRAHGFAAAWGMYAYPGNKRDLGADAVVDDCFSHGRAYGTGTNAVPGPFLARVRSVDGGRCADASRPCSRMATPRAYTDPSTLVSQLSAPTGRWGAVQWYRFVTDRYGTQSSAIGWDCTAGDWRAHWTTKSELYCYGDFLNVIGRIPAGVTVTSPAVVAQAFGRGF